MVFPREIILQHPTNSGCYFRTDPYDRRVENFIVVTTKSGKKRCLYWGHNAYKKGISIHCVLLEYYDKSKALKRIDASQRMTLEVWANKIKETMQ